MEIINLIAAYRTKNSCCAGLLIHVDANSSLSNTQNNARACSINSEGLLTYVPACRDYHTLACTSQCWKIYCFYFNSAQAFKMHITRGKQAFLAVFHFVAINAYLISAMSLCHTNMLLSSPLAAWLDAQINTSFSFALIRHLLHFMHQVRAENYISTGFHLLFHFMPKVFYRWNKLIQSFCKTVHQIKA